MLIVGSVDGWWLVGEIQIDGRNVVPLISHFYMQLVRLLLTLQQYPGIGSYYFQIFTGG